MLSCDGACNKLLSALNNHRSFEQWPLLWLVGRCLNEVCYRHTPQVSNPHSGSAAVPSVTRQPQSSQSCRIPCVQSWVTSVWGHSTGDVRLPSGKQCLPLGERQFLPVEQEGWHTARNWGCHCAPPAASVFVTGTERQSITACLCACGCGSVQSTQSWYF